MIQPLSGGALPASAPTSAADLAASLAPDAGVPAASPLDVPAGAPRGVDGLRGTPAALLGFHADANGAGGGRSGGGAARKADPLAGAALPGQKGVAVVRSFGDPKGYESRHHAIAWARAAGSDRAMVVAGADGRWHAVETNVAGQAADAAAGKLRHAVPVGRVDAARYEALKRDAMQANDPAKWKVFAAYALGVPESEIEVIGKGGTPSPTKITINLSPDFDAEGRTAGFDPRQPAWIQLGPKAFDRPANALATLAHEEVHAAHRRLTGERYAAWQASPHGKETFRQWAAHQARSPEGVRIADIVAGYEDGTAAATELEAHVEAARLAFASGDLVQARTDLLKVATLRNMPLLQTQLPSIAALKQLRDGLAGDARAVFDEIARAARPNSVLRGL